jgi:Sigma-70, region 4
MNSELLSASEVGRRLGISAERVRQLARKGQLNPVERTTLGQLWASEAVEEFAATRGRWGRYGTDLPQDPRAPATTERDGAPAQAQPARDVGDRDG